MTDWAQGATVAGVGLAVLGTTIGIFRSWAKAQAARDNAQASLDERLPKLIETISKPFQEIIQQQREIIDEERKEKGRAQDARDKAVENLVTFMQASDSLHRTEIANMRTESTAAIDKVRGDLLESIKRAHDRVENCERGHAVDREALANANSRIKQLEENQYRAALATPTAPAVIVPSAAVVAPGTAPA